MFNASKLYAVLAANTLLRSAMTASGSNALIGFYLADLALAGQNVNSAIVGNLNATHDAIALLFAIPFGILIDRFSPRVVLVTGALCGAVATQLFGLTGMIGIFFVARALEGLGSSATTPGILAYLTDATTSVPEKRGQVMSWFEISLFLGLAVGNLVSGPLWERLGTTAFGLISVFYLAAAFIFLRRAETGARAGSTGSPLIGLRQTFRNKSLLRLAVPWLVFNSVVGLWLSQLAFQLNGPTRVGQWLVGRLTPSQTSLVLFLYIITFSIGVWYFGLQIGRTSRARIMRTGFMAMFGVVACLFLLNNSSEWTRMARFSLFPFYALAAGLQGAFPPAALSFLADVAGNSQGRGSAMGIYTLLLSLGNISGALLGGQLGHAYALNGLLIGTLILALVGLFSLRFLREKPIPVISV